MKKALVFYVKTNKNLTSNYPPLIELKTQKKKNAFKKKTISFRKNKKYPDLNNGNK